MAADKNREFSKNTLKCTYLIRKYRIKVWFMTGLTLGIVVSIVSAVLYLRQLKDNNREDIELEKPIAYTEDVKQILCNLLGEGTSLAIYLEEQNVVISNPDFGRSSTCDAIGIAGDASVLYPGSNALLSGEEGYCLLGKKTAFELFGTTKVTGRTVKIRDKIYQVTGIAYGKENVCAYELSPEQEIWTEKIAFLYTSQSQKGILKRKLENLFS